MARLFEKYKKEAVPALKEKLNLKNVMAVPRLEKIVVNAGVGKAIENKDRIEAAVKDIAAITGQKPVVTRARQSISGFKLRQGEKIGCKVTLRGKVMYEFLDKLISVVIPRLRDFRGLDPKSFDTQGNFNMGIGEQSVFPEISIDQVQFVQGMDITMVISNGSKKASHELLKALGMPFRTQTQTDARTTGGTVVSSVTPTTGATD
jgi:large subunit ribosomal protein L5